MERYIPKELLARLEAARASHALEGERRVVTILFCDVQGSTALAEKLDPEEWAEVMTGAFEHLIAPIYSYEGTLARLMGDAILAFFGAPIAHEDDPLRAVLAGLGIVEGIRPYGERVRRERGFDFEVRVGINTGLVVVGEIGSDLRVEYTAMGDAVNLAARLEQTARPGTVQISADTHRRVSPFVESEPLGGIAVKGREAPIVAYRILGPRAVAGPARGLHDLIVGPRAPLIDRRAEMAALRSALTDLRAGRGGIIWLVGEAGLGKSRLIGELRDEWKATQLAEAIGRWPRWCEVGGVSYERARTYGFIQRHLRCLIAAKVNDQPAAVQHVLARAIDVLAPEQRGRVGRALAILLGVPDQADASAPEGEALKRELHESMVLFWRAWAAEIPAVAVFDDLHWADPASVELIGHLFDQTVDVPILFLCAARPDRTSPVWGLLGRSDDLGVGRPVKLALDPLAPTSCLAMVDGLLGAPELPARLREAIRARADGNPFFVEEIVRSLIEDGALARDETSGRWYASRSADEIAIPSSLRGLLTARIDQLDAAARQTLQLAAVVGRSFSGRILGAIAEGPADLACAIDTLIDADVIRLDTNGPTLAFTFRHALIQEAIYSGILRKRRRVLHRRVGEAIETLHVDRVDEQATLLAQHFFAADDPRSARYDRLAGDAAARLYANAEAIAHFGRALAVARRVDAPVDEWRHLFSQLGRALELSARYDEALATYAEMATLARERCDRAIELTAVMASATVRSTPNPAHDPVLAEDLLNRALALAGELGDRPAECRILWSLLLLNTYAFRPERAIAFGQRALALARDLGLTKQLAFTLNDLHRAYLFDRQVESARAVLDEALGLWRALDNRPMLIDCLASTAYVEFLRGAHDRALACSDEASTLAREIDNIWGQSFSRMITGTILFDRGEPDRAIAITEEAVRLADASGQPIVAIGTRADLGWVIGASGDVPRGLAVASRATEIAGQRFPILRPWPLAVTARLHLLAGDLAAAQTAVDTARRELRWDSSLLAPVLVLLAQGEVALASADPTRALAVLDELVTYLDSTGTRAYLAEALHLKARAHQALGDAATAEQLWQLARTEAEALGLRRLLGIIPAATVTAG